MEWPNFMGTLQPELSESPIPAVAPASVTVRPPDPALPEHQARWSGIWSGWAGDGRVCDLKLIGEEVTAEGATVFCVRASERQGVFRERLLARWVRNELQGTFATGATLSLRMRSTAVVEVLWREPDGRWIAGVLSQASLTDERTTVRVPTGFFEQETEVTLEMVIFKPPGAGPFPTLMFNHGSTGWGNDPALFTTTWTCPALTRFFVDRGWLVALPQRRGRGKSAGLYDEGFEEDRSRYSFRPERSLPGVERGLADLDAAVAFLLQRPDVNRSEMLIGGNSRGGLLAVAYAGTRPPLFCGVLNFVGGWVSDQCDSPEAINTVTFRRGASYAKPMLWLYADNDPLYGLDHSRQNFEAFVEAGGLGSFHVVDMEPGMSGHDIVGLPELWCQLLESYVARACTTATCAFGPDGQPRTAS